MKFENIMESGAFVPNNIFRCMLFQKHYFGLKGSLWWPNCSKFIDNFGSGSQEEHFVLGGYVV